jgi:hypothetical protein
MSGMAQSKNAEFRKNVYGDSAEEIGNAEVLVECEVGTVEPGYRPALLCTMASLMGIAQDAISVHRSGAYVPAAGEALDP